jgi:hypothetical protein
MSRDELEVAYLIALMRLDAKIWSKRSRSVQEIGGSGEAADETQEKQTVIATSRGAARKGERSQKGNEGKRPEKKQTGVSQQGGP